MPAQIPDTQAAVRAAIDRSPEEDVLSLPGIRNQLGVLQQEVEHVGVHHRLRFELLAEVITDDVAAALLVLGEVEFHLLLIPDELSPLLVLFDFPAFGLVGRSVAVDGVDDRYSDDRRRGFAGRRVTDEQLGDFLAQRFVGLDLAETLVSVAALTINLVLERLQDLKPCTNTAQDIALNNILATHDTLLFLAYPATVHHGQT